jgi:hypothetical protein
MAEVDDIGAVSSVEDDEDEAEEEEELWGREMVQV